MERRAAYGRAGAMLGGVLVLDQATKLLVRDGVQKGSVDPIFPLVELVHVENRGVAFGALEGKTALVAIVIAFALVALGVYFVRNAERRGMWLPAGLLAGGAIGNVIDRVVQGAVTDMIKLPAWPAFNLADVAITFGVIALLYVVEKEEGPDAIADPA